MNGTLLRTGIAAAMLWAGHAGAEAPGGAERPEALAPGFAGVYLKARHAAASNAYALAAEGYREALGYDPGNRDIAERAIVAGINAGQMGRATDLALAMHGAGRQSQIGALAILTGVARERRWDEAARLLDEGLSVGPLVDGLARGWTALGTGDAAGAMAAFDEVVAVRGLRPFGLVHKAYARAVIGDDAGAEAIWAGTAPEADGRPPRLSRRAAEARIAGLSRLGRFDAATGVLDRLFGAELDPGLLAMRAALEAGRALPPPIADARAGLAESLFTVAAALRGEASDGYTLLYVRAAQAMEPAHEDSALMAARLLRGLGRHEDAVTAYAAVPEGAGAFHAARLGMAETLRETGRTADAIALLRSLAGSHGALPQVHAALGAALLREGRAAEAAASYDASIRAHGGAAIAPWKLLLGRARARERLGEWDAAKADLRQALEIAPESPSVLTFLGYKMAVRGERLNEALRLVEAAAARRPDNGFIADSLGWVLFRMGLHDRAVAQLEHAARLSPAEPVVSDHLGDAYWAAGRQREARFQWRRALAFGPDAEQAGRIARKLRVGLDAVMTEEAAAAAVPSLTASAEDR